MNARIYEHKISICINTFATNICSELMKKLHFNEMDNTSLILCKSVSSNILYPL